MRLHAKLSSSRDDAPAGYHVIHYGVEGSEVEYRERSSSSQAEWGKFYSHPGAVSTTST